LPAAPADTAPTSLKWIGSNTVTLGPAGSANNVGTCTYSVALPYLGAFPLKLTATPTAGNPADPDLSNNSIIGTVTVKSSGAFTTNSTIINLAQQWSTAAPTGFPVTNMSLQRVQVDQLALLVLPTQATLGYFSIDSATISQPNSSGVKVSFGNGTASGTVLKSDAGTKCVSNGVFTQTPLNPVVEPQLSYFADICAQPQLDAGGSPNGFQVITVTFEQSLTGTVAAPQPDYVFNPGSTVTVRIVMSFTLNGSTYHDRVSATVNIKVPPAISGLQDIVTGLTSWNLGPLNQSDPTQVSITSP
jgi:hypothetical protein